MTSRANSRKRPPPPDPLPESEDPEVDVENYVPLRTNVGVLQREPGRTTTAIALQTHHVHLAEESILLCGVGHSAVRRLMDRVPGLKRKRANQLLRGAQKLWNIEGRMVNRESTIDMHRQRLLRLYQMALERKKALAVGAGIGIQHVKYVDDPDLRSAIDAAEKLKDLDGVTDDDLQKTPEGARQAALRAWAESYGAPALEAENEESEP